MLSLNVFFPSSNPPDVSSKPAQRDMNDRSVKGYVSQQTLTRVPYQIKYKCFR